MLLYGRISHRHEAYMNEKRKQGRAFHCKSQMFSLPCVKVICVSLIYSMLNSNAWTLEWYLPDNFTSNRKHVSECLLILFEFDIFLPNAAFCFKVQVIQEILGRKCKSKFWFRFCSITDNKCEDNWTTIQVYTLAEKSISSLHYKSSLVCFTISNEYMWFQTRNKKNTLQICEKRFKPKTAKYDNILFECNRLEIKVRFFLWKAYSVLGFWNVCNSNKWENVFIIYNSKQYLIILKKTAPFEISYLQDTHFLMSHGSEDIGLALIQFFFSKPRKAMAYIL